MNRRRLLALSSGLLAATLAGCVGEEGTPRTDTSTDQSGSGGSGTDYGTDDGDNHGSENTLTEDLDTVVRETNGFAFDLYSELLAENAEENLFVSPLSIGLALAMTYAGAREETRAQMRDVLRYELDDDRVHAAFGALQEELDERGDEDDGDSTGGEDGTDDSDDGNEQEEEYPFELSVVNSVWGQEEYPFEELYLDILDSYYGGGLREVDFVGDFEGAREDINDWVAAETNDRIDDLLPEGSLDELTRLVLVNAVYFLANWKHTFSEDATSEQQFNALDGESHTVQMMYKDRSWQYAEVDDTQAVELPYVGDEVSMLVILPPENEFEEYEDRFDTETLSTIVDALDSREGTVQLPRFELDGSFQLKDSLEAMGMTDAFDPNEANFDGIADTEETLFIHDAYHDTFIAVDEEGTEAAAATAVVIGDESAPIDPFEFVADRPFLFAIRDRPTDAVLFVGRAVDPVGWD